MSKTPNIHGLLTLADVRTGLTLTDGLRELLDLPANELLIELSTLRSGLDGLDGTLTLEPNNHLLLLGQLETLTLSGDLDELRSTQLKQLLTDLNCLPLLESALLQLQPLLTVLGLSTTELTTLNDMQASLAMTDGLGELLDLPADGLLLELSTLRRGLERLDGTLTLELGDQMLLMGQLKLLALSGRLDALQAAELEQVLGKLPFLRTLESALLQLHPLLSAFGTRTTTSAAPICSL